MNQHECSPPDLDIQTEANAATTSGNRRRYDVDTLRQRGLNRARELPRRLGVVAEALSQARIIEIGCGFGETTWAVREMYNAKATGIDPYPRYLPMPWYNADIHTKDDVLELNPACFGTFDFAHSYTVWEHIEQPREALQEMFKLLRPGGRAFITFNLYLGASASHLTQHLDIPWMHLLHSDAEIREMMWKRHRIERGMSWVNKLSCLHYLKYFEEIGFRLIKQWYNVQRMPEAYFQKHFDKLKGYPRDEFDKNFMNVCLERP